MSAAGHRERLEGLSRAELVEEARRWGVRKPEVMTRVELVDEVIRLATPNPEERKKLRGWLGVARDLLASAVERGLNLPDAAALIRGDVRFEPLRPPDKPIATVTLAEIYGTQGHFDRALDTLDRVLGKEPEHEVARKLRDRISRDKDTKKVRGSVPPPPPEDLDDPSFEDRVTLPPKPDAVTRRPPPKGPTNGADEPEPETPRPSALRPRGSNDDAEPLTSRRGAADTGPTDDGVVVVRTGPSRVLAYFELGPELRKGAPLLRVVELVPRASSVDRTERRLPLTGARGSIALEGFEPDSVIRAAIGVERGDKFETHAVAAEVREGAKGDVVWAPRRTVDYGAIVRRGLPSGVPAEA